jgi:hypothetical protein
MGVVKDESAVHYPLRRPEANHPSSPSGVP